MKEVVFILRILICLVLILILYNFLFIYPYLHYAILKSNSDIEFSKIKRKSVLKRLFVQFPAAFWRDWFHSSPDTFKEQGLVIFTGRQGNGKTIAMTEYIMTLQEHYKKCKTITNYAYAFEDNELNHWQQLLDYKNGEYGVVVGMDELQNWFNSNQSKNFPPEMLSVVTQNRKNRRLICGTAQQFYMLSKNIRTQCTEVRKCLTILRCLTIVRRFNLVITPEGEIKEEIPCGMYFFIHTDELRAAYDTYKVIDSLSASGFKDNPMPVPAAMPEIHLKFDK